MQARMELLAAHRSILIDEIALLQEHLLKLDDKIAYYAAKISTKTTTEPFKM